jgi:hypothetical protein
MTVASKSEEANVLFERVRRSLEPVRPHRGGDAREAIVKPVETGTNGMTARVRGEYVDDVAPLAGAHRNQARRLHRRVIEHFAQLTADFIQACTTRRNRVFVRVVPLRPV